ncbi:hypothetical protein AAE478_009610 [Parahypoxylon ruwenzoriense]
MALVGLSLVLASVVYVAIWRPPLLQTFLALWRGEPRIHQPPTTRRPPSSENGADQDSPQAVPDTNRHPSEPTSAADRAATPSPPPLFVTREPPSSPSSQTTPKAKAASPHLPNGSDIPSFSLSAAGPPTSAATIARSADATTSPVALSLPSASSQPPTIAAATSMAPPPLPTARRPPILNNFNPNRSSLGVPPSASRPSPLPNRQPNPSAHDRQPGSSTLAPPPTHSSRPSKPSRKVTLEPGCSPLDWARLANHPAADLRGLGPGAPYLRVTPSMLRRQTGRKGKDAWTALGGRVYNISPYLPFHPGGEPELLRVAGRDGSKLFGEIHPWVNYETMLASCLIGLLVEEHEAKSSGEMDAMD